MGGAGLGLMARFVELLGGFGPIWRRREKSGKLIPKLRTKGFHRRYSYNPLQSYSKSEEVSKKKRHDLAYASVLSQYA